MGTKGKGPKRPRGQKRTKPDTPAEVLGPRRLTGAARKREIARQEAELQDELERRRRAAAVEASLNLDAIDLKILQLLQQHAGITQEQIGGVVGLRRQAVSERVNAPKFKAVLDRFAQSALEVFESNKARAARVLGDLLASPDDRIKIRAAIAHMWPEIHREDKGSGGDFVQFIQEAFELASGKDAGAAGAAGTPTGTGEGSKP